MLFFISFIGLFTNILIDVLLKVEAVIRFLTIPFVCKLKNKKTISRGIQEWIQANIFEKFFKLNSFEIDTLEK